MAIDRHTVLTSARDSRTRVHEVLTATQAIPKPYTVPQTDSRQGGRVGERSGRASAERPGATIEADSTELSRPAGRDKPYSLSPEGEYARVQPHPNPLRRACAHLRGIPVTPLTVGRSALRSARAARDDGRRRTVHSR